MISALGKVGILIALFVAIAPKAVAQKLAPIKVSAIPTIALPVLRGGALVSFARPTGPQKAFVLGRLAEAAPAIGAAHGDKDPMKASAELATLFGERSSGNSEGGGADNPGSPGGSQSLQRQLNHAAATGDLKTIRRLVDAGADVNAHDGWFTPLGRAAQYGQHRAAELLMQLKAEPDLKDPYGRVALDWAIQSRHMQVILVLKPNKQSGASVNIISGGRSLLVVAFNAVRDFGDQQQIAFQKEAYFWLFDMGFDFKKSGASAVDSLAAATRGATPQLVENLLTLPEIAAVVNERNYVGSTPLIEAMFNYHYEADVLAIVNLLLARKADPNLANSSGGTPLSAAQYTGLEKVIRALRKAGAR